MPSGICSVGGTCTWPSRPPFAGAGVGAAEIAPVMSLPTIGATVGGLAPCVIVICEPSVPGMPGAGLGFSFAFSADAALTVALAERLSFCALAAAACAARRAAAMKLDVLTDSFGAAAGISLSALSEAAMRSDGEAVR